MEASALKLSNRQKIAMVYTCKLAEECQHPRFRDVEWPVSSILTLNSGFE